eukprot:jgi/Mesvir1/5410/Mv15476-RA.4
MASDGLEGWLLSLARRFSDGGVKYHILRDSATTMLCRLASTQVGGELAAAVCVVHSLRLLLPDLFCLRRAGAWDTSISDDARLQLCHLLLDALASHAPPRALSSTPDGSSNSAPSVGGPKRGPGPTGTDASTQPGEDPDLAALMVRDASPLLSAGSGHATSTLAARLVLDLMTRELQGDVGGQGHGQGCGWQGAVEFCASGEPPPAAPATPCVVDPRVVLKITRTFGITTDDLRDASLQLPPTPHCEPPLCGDAADGSTCGGAGGAAQGRAEGSHWAASRDVARQLQEGAQGESGAPVGAGAQPPAPWQRVVNSYIRGLLFGPPPRRSLAPAAGLVAHLSLAEFQGEDVLHLLARSGQVALARAFAARLGRDAQASLVAYLTTLGLYKPAYECVVAFGLRDLFPDAERRYKEGSIARMVTRKGQWEVAAAFAGTSAHLRRFLALLALDLNEPGVFADLCERFELTAGQLLSSDEGVPEQGDSRWGVVAAGMGVPGASATNGYLELPVGVRVRMVACAGDLAYATQCLLASSVVGMDTEWKPTFSRSAPPRPVAILSLASATQVFLFDMIALTGWDCGGQGEGAVRAMGGTTTGDGGSGEGGVGQARGDEDGEGVCRGGGGASGDGECDSDGTHPASASKYGEQRTAISGSSTGQTAVEQERAGWGHPAGDASGMLDLPTTTATFNNNSNNTVAACPHQLQEALTRLFSAPAVVKVGYALAGDLSKLRSSFPDLLTPCLAHGRSFLDVGAVWDASRPDAGGDSHAGGGSNTGGDGDNGAASAAPIRGLSGLAEACLGRPLKKSQRMSDWEARPLSNAQLAYAALDAHCLLGIFARTCQGGQPPRPDTQQAGDLGPRDAANGLACSAVDGQGARDPGTMARDACCPCGEGSNVLTSLYPVVAGDMPVGTNAILPYAHWRRLLFSSGPRHAGAKQPAARRGSGDGPERPARGKRQQKGKGREGGESDKDKEKGSDKDGEADKDEGRGIAPRPQRHKSWECHACQGAGRVPWQRPRWEQWPHCLVHLQTASWCPPPDACRQATHGHHPRICSCAHLFVHGDETGSTCHPAQTSGPECRAPGVRGNVRCSHSLRAWPTPMIPRRSLCVACGCVRYARPSTACAARPAIALSIVCVLQAALPTNRWRNHQRWPAAFSHPLHKAIACRWLRHAQSVPGVLRSAARQA